MVNFANLNYANLILRFRQYSLMQQSVIAGFVVLLIYIPYSYFLLNLNIVESVVMSIYSSVLFIAVYYITSSFITRKTRKMAAQSAGPKKGLRK